MHTTTVRPTMLLMLVSLGCIAYTIAMTDADEQSPFMSMTRRAMGNHIRLCGNRLTLAVSTICAANGMRLCPETVIDDGR